LVRLVNRINGQTKEETPKLKHAPRSRSRSSTASEPIIEALKISNLPYQVEADHILKVFQGYSVTDIKVDESNSGQAAILFDSPYECARAKKELEG